MNITSGFGDNVQRCYNGVGVLIPTFSGFMKFYRCFTQKELKDIILNPDNYVFIQIDVQSSIPYCQWDAEVQSVENYIQYLKDHGLRL